MSPWERKEVLSRWHRGSPLGTQENCLTPESWSSGPDLLCGSCLTQATHPPTHQPIYPPTQPNTHPLIYPSIHPNTHPSTQTPIHPPKHPPIHPPIHSSTHPSTQTPALLSRHCRGRACGVSCLLLSQPRARNSGSIVGAEPVRGPTCPRLSTTCPAHRPEPALCKPTLPRLLWPAKPPTPPALLCPALSLFGCQRLPALILNSPADENHMTEQ